MTQEQVYIYDTTLRDGTQAEGFSLGVQDKVTLARALDNLGVHYIEGGWPGSNPKDEAFFQQMREQPLRQAKLVAFGATHHKKYRSGAECPLLQKTMESGVQYACLFGKTWRLHSEQLLGLSDEDNLRIIASSVAFLVAQGIEVFFDAEHFFDGYRDDPSFALSCLQAAADAGASALCLCDTRGASLPGQITEITTAVSQAFPEMLIGIHVHNDRELAVANSLAAVEAGARLVQGTINGIGERCGNANLCSIIPNLELEGRFTTIGREQMQKLLSISMLTGTRGNYRVPKNLPFVGHSAFAHKGGIHVSAVRKNPVSYEFCDPECVGNKRRITISDLSGRSNLLSYAEKLGFASEDFDAAFWSEILSKLKQAEERGLQFEGAEASFELFFRRYLPNARAPFTLENFFVHTSQIMEQQGAPVEATVLGHVGEQAFHTVGLGSGPVGALDEALRKALTPHFPMLEAVGLTDYKVRIVEMESGTGAKTRVVMEHSDGKKIWNTVGVSQNIIEASLQALLDAFLWAVLKE